MCRISFNKVGQLLRDVVDCHGGVLVATREEVQEHLRRELGGEVEESAINRYSLALRPQEIASSPHPMFGDGAVVVLWDTRKHPTSSEALQGVRKMNIAPGAQFALNERRLGRKVAV